jgi:hypothetical protein
MSGLGWRARTHGTSLGALEMSVACGAGLRLGAADEACRSAGGAMGRSVRLPRPCLYCRRPLLPGCRTRDAAVAVCSWSLCRLCMASGDRRLVAFYFANLPLRLCLRERRTLRSWPPFYGPPRKRGYGAVTGGVGAGRPTGLVAVEEAVPLAGEGRGCFTGNVGGGLGRAGVSRETSVRRTGPGGGRGRPRRGRGRRR